MIASGCKRLLRLGARLGVSVGIKRGRIPTLGDFRRVRGYYPPAYTEKVVGLWHILSYCKEAAIAGNIVECGVGRGVSFFLLGKWATHLGLGGRLYGFDSFRGFPQPSPEDQSPRRPRRADWSDTSVAHVRGHFEAADLSDYYSAHVKIVEGFFEETLISTDISQICFLHLDCDLYQSYRTALQVLAPLVDGRGVILYDEYGSPRWPGATRATDELLPNLGHVMFVSRLMNRYLSVNRDAARRPSPELLGMWRSLDMYEA